MLFKSFQTMRDKIIITLISNSGKDNTHMKTIDKYNLRNLDAHIVKEILANSQELSLTPHCDQMS